MATTAYTVYYQLFLFKLELLPSFKKLNVMEMKQTSFSLDILFVLFRKWSWKIRKSSKITQKIENYEQS